MRRRGVAADEKALRGAANAATGIEGAGPALFPGEALRPAKGRCPAEPTLPEVQIQGSSSDSYHPNQLYATQIGPRPRHAVQRSFGSPGRSIRALGCSAV